MATKRLIRNNTLSSGVRIVIDGAEYHWGVDLILPDGTKRSLGAIERTRRSSGWRGTPAQYTFFYNKKAQRLGLPTGGDSRVGQIVEWLVARADKIPLERFLEDELISKEDDKKWAEFNKRLDDKNAKVTS